MEYLTSVEVAQRFKIPLNTLTAYLTRHPELRPKRRAGTAFMWTPDEFERLAEHRMRPKRRPKQQTE